LGGNSLTALRAMSKIQHAFGVAPGMESIFSLTTIESLAEAVNGLQENRNRIDLTATARQANQEKPFCWIGASTQASVLSAQMDLNGLLLGFDIGPEMIGNLEAPYRAEEIAECLVEAILSQQRQGPYRLGGYCLSAVFAYEVARQLTARGKEVSLLTLFEPLNPRQDAKASFTTGLRRMGIRIRVRSRELSRLQINEFSEFARSRWNGLHSIARDVVWRIAARTGLVQPEIRPSNLEKVLFFAASSYRPQPVACRTVIFRSSDSPILAAGDPYFGWRDFLTGVVETHEISGNHLGIFREPNVRALAAKLRQYLESATQIGTLPDEWQGEESQVRS